MAFITYRKKKAKSLQSAVLVIVVVFSFFLFFFSTHYVRLYISQWLEQYFPCHMMILQCDVCSFYPEVASLFPPIRSGQTYAHHLDFLGTGADSIQCPKPPTVCPTTLAKTVNQQ